MMSKKHFKAFADAIALIEDEQQREGVLTVVCRVCYEDNPRFDQSRFVEWIRRVRANESLVGLR